MWLSFERDENYGLEGQISAFEWLNKSNYIKRAGCLDTPAVNNTKSYYNYSFTNKLIVWSFY